jgi:hypothetical protein
MELTVDQANEVSKAQAITRMREKAAVFRDVFGVPGKLTPHGKVILESLETAFGRGNPKNILDDHGRTDALQTWRQLGQRDVIQSIYDTLTWKETA